MFRRKPLPPARHPDPRVNQIEDRRAAAGRAAAEARALTRDAAKARRKARRVATMDDAASSALEGQAAALDERAREWERAAAAELAEIDTILARLGDETLLY